MTLALTWDQVLTWRMERQFLDRPPDLDVPQIVRRLAGVQAQVASYTEQAIAIRNADAASDVASALADRTIVKTWAQRGTLHLLVVDDAAAYLSLLAAARTWEKGAWQRAFATAEQLGKIAEAVVELLDGAELTREELTAAIIERTGDATVGEQLSSGWGAVLKPLAWQGLLYPPARRSLVSKAAGWISPVVVVGGRVAGTWEVDRDELTIGLFDEAGRLHQRALDEEIALLEKVLDRRLTASITTV